ncbi:hypothetical protein P3S67_022971 [Capsicum chacoense]
MRRESPLRIPLLNCFLKKPLRHLDPLKINYNLNYGPKVEYRVWNPFRSKVAASVLGGVDANWIKPGTHVLYLGAALGTTVSHVSDIVGPQGVVYAVEFSHRSGRDLVNMAKFMQWNFLIEAEGTWLTWQRNAQTLFPSLKMLGTQQNTECLLECGCDIL